MASLNQVSIELKVSGERESTQAINRLGSAVLKNVKVAERLERGYKSLDRAFNKGRITAQQYARGVQELDRAVDRAYAGQDQFEKQVRQTTSALNAQTAATNQFGGSTQFASRRLNAMGVVTQQAGYQIGDFLVQIQGGTNVFVALGQQLTQLIGTFGIFAKTVRTAMIVSTLGILVPIMTAVGAAILRVRESSDESSQSFSRMTGEIEKLKAQFGPFVPVLESIGNAFRNVKELAIDGINAILNNLDRLFAYSATIASFFAGRFVAGFVAARIAAFSLSGAIVALGAAIRTTLIRTGIGILIVAVGEAVLAFSKLTQITGNVGQSFVIVGEIIREVFSKESIEAIFGFLGAKFLEIVNGMVVDAALYISDIVLSFSDGFNLIASIVVGTVEGIKSVFSQLPAIIGNAAKRGVNLAITAFQKMAQGALVPLNLLIKGANALGANLQELSVGGVFDGLMLDVSDGGTSLGEAFVEGFNRGYDETEISTPIMDTLSGIIESAMSAEQSAARMADIFGSRFAELNPRLVELIEQIRALGDEADEIDIRDWFSGLPDGVGEDGGSGAGRSLSDELTEIQEKIQSVADTLRDAMSEAFMSMVEGTKSFSQAVRDMARAVIKQLFDILVVQQLVGSFDAKTGTGSGIVGAIMGAFVNANGNVFQNGSHVQAYANGGVFQGGAKVQAFATGGIVGSPTFFPMANGNVGLMGEAGPEAIMPLKRGKGGRLGVEVSGEQGNVVINQTFAFQANGDDSVKRIIASEAPKIAALTQKQMLDARRRGGVVRDTFA